MAEHWDTKVQVAWLSQLCLEIQALMLQLRHFSFVIPFPETNVIVLLVFHLKKKYLYFHVCDLQHFKNTGFYNS